MPKEACPNNLAPTSSTTAQLVMGDAIAVSLLACKDFSDKDFARFHPGGTLGKRFSVKLSDILHGNTPPKVEPDALINTWDIPNVKSNHKEKTIHPCQFPVALVERLVLGLSNKGNLVFDPFMGVGSSGVAAVYNDRKFIGSEIESTYVKEAKNRLKKALKKEDIFRKDAPVYDYRKSALSKRPKDFNKK